MSRKRCPHCGREIGPVARMSLSLPSDLVSAVRTKAAVEKRTVSSVIEDAIIARRDSEKSMA